MTYNPVSGTLSLQARELGVISYALHTAREASVNEDIRAECERIYLEMTGRPMPVRED